MPQTDFFNRPPRIQLEFPEGEIDIPNPPSRNAGMGRLGLISLGMPLIMLIGYAFIAARGGNPLFVLPLGITAIISSTVGYLTWKRNQENEDRKQNSYTEVLAQLEANMAAAHERQQDFYNHNSPPPDSILQMAQSRSPRLWERRIEDADFGSVRLGIGDVPSHMVFNPPDNNVNTDAPQMSKALRLARDYVNVHNVPITISLREQHAIGLTGSSEIVRNFVRAMVVDLTGLHSPNDLRLYIVGTPESKPEWSGLGWLPHSGFSRQSERSENQQFCFETSQMPGFWGFLQTELERRQTQIESEQTSRDALPLLVVIVDIFTKAEVNSLFDQVVAETAVSTLLNFGHDLNTCVLFLLPTEEDVPGECRSLIRLVMEPQKQLPLFAYLEVGVNSPRFNGVADQLSAQAAEINFAKKLSSLAIRTTYGADLPVSLSLLELNRVSTVDELHIWEHWQQSEQPSDQAPSTLLGMMRGGKPREIIFHTERDGVHGLLAGTTGTGKSELLMSLILGLAIRYSPTAVNFVLVDYKGGTAFEAFRALPHVVDVITNLHGQAGVRAFTAIRAELTRRTALLAQSRADDIGVYRARGLHQQAPLPYLFVIIDEFAEMIKERPEFRPQLESIARLGRAPGVHLLLATQRPSGLVSDQIRANTKLKICLRVETVDDSRELLDRADAAFLPPNIAGRAYLQVGKDRVDLIQVARARAPHRRSRQDVAPATAPSVIWTKRQKQKTNVEAVQSQSNTIASTLLDYMVQLAKDRRVPVQVKPWHDPLPEQLDLGDMELNPAVSAWFNGRNAWQGIDWAHKSSMCAPVGLVDQPLEAQQFPLVFDFNVGHYIVFGTSGSGKTMLLRTTVLALAATHSPAELQIYALDFGGRGLSALKNFPHIGSIILLSEEEKVRRLLRKLSAEIEQRKALFSAAQVNDLAEYNSSGEVLPAILCLLDNFAAFRENYAEAVDLFNVIAREGRAFGVHLLLTAEQANSVPGRTVSLFSERLALQLADPSEYSTIVGRTSAEIEDIPGRGVMRFERTALEFQIALPLALPQSDDHSPQLGDESRSLDEVAVRMSAAWQGKTPDDIAVLSAAVSWRSLPVPQPSRGITVALGLQDSDLQPFEVTLTRNPHFAIIGPPLSGKTVALQTWVIALARRYTPEQVQIWLVDFQQRKIAEYGGDRRLSELPHVRQTVAEVAELEAMIATLQTSLEAPDKSAAEIFVLIDNYDDLTQAVISAGKRDLYTKLTNLGRQYSSDGLHFIVAGSRNIANMGDEFVKLVTARHFGLGLDGYDSPLALGGRLRSSSAEFPPGRGYVVNSGRVALIQVATPQDENAELESSLDRWVREITEPEAVEAAE